MLRYFHVMKQPKIYTYFFNPYLTNGFSDRYQLGESTFIFRDIRSDFYLLSHF